MTKLLQQLSFSSNYNSNYFDVDVAGIEPIAVKKYNGDGASLSASAGSKRSALSASDAECFSLCLGAGPLCAAAGSKRSVSSGSDAEWSLCLGAGICGGPDVPAHGSAPPGGVTSGASSPATPSTPTHDDNNRDLLSSLLWSSSSTLCGSAESLAEPEHPALHTQANREVLAKILERKDARPVKIDFKIFVTPDTATRWEAVVSGGSMFLRVPSVLAAGSKDAFLLLLDFAEEHLRCNTCIICVLKTRPDRATLLRTFMFMGFQVLPPGSPLLPREINNPDYIFLHYTMQ